MEPLPTGEFLKKLGFVGGNPFSDTQAEEEDNLPKYFVDLPAFYKILDTDTGKHKSSILSADRGSGKSANRKNVERWLTHGPQPFASSKSFKGKWSWGSKVLVVPYINFDRLSTLVKDDFSKLRPEDHVQSILWNCVACLVQFLEKHWEKIDPAAVSQWDIVRLGYYLIHYSDEWGNVRDMALHKPAKKKVTLDSFLRNACAKAQKVKGLSAGGPTALLQGFVEIARALSIHNIVVLVDGVDEIGLTADKPELGAMLLKPLIAERALMQMDGMVFKFFLPTQVVQKLKEIPETRLGERIKFYEIEWSDEAIQILFTQRLEAFSNKKLSDLAQLTGPDARDVASLLANHVENNPRNLLRLAEQVLIRLEESEKALGKKDKKQPPRITRTTIDEAVAFYDKNIVPRDSYTTEKGVMRSTKWSITPDLQVMYKGKIISKEKLDPKEHKILVYFLQHPGQRVERTEIGKEVWKDKWVDKFDWVLTQRISTLRKKIGNTRIETVRGVGYIFHAE